MPIVAHWYRATCFGDPVGPWRTSISEAWADLEGQQLGSYDELGTFYITVPGGLARVSEWMDFDVWERCHQSQISPAFARRARSPGQQSCTARHRLVGSAGAGDCPSRAQVARDR